MINAFFVRFSTTLRVRASARSNRNIDKHCDVIYVVKIDLTIFYITRIVVKLKIVS